MDRKSMKIAVLACLSALCGCAGFGREARREPVERLDEHGVSEPVLKVEVGSTELVISPDAVPVPPPSRCPTKSALLLPLSLGLLAAACGNPSASPAGRTEDAARLVSSASPTPSVDPVLQWNSLHGCCARSAFVSLDGSDAAARE